MSTASATPGRFITAEGQDGAGKTTNLDLVERIVRSAGYDVLRTREPGGTPLGEELRQLVLHRGDLDIDPVAELLLIFADRAQHLNGVIRPALATGTWVVCDRFTDATYAYQGGGSGNDTALIEELERRVQDGLRPDLTLLFDVDITTSTQRTGTSNEYDRFESQASAFKERVRNAYLSRARREPERIRIIDGGQDLKQVEHEVGKVIRDYIASIEE